MGWQWLGLLPRLSPVSLLRDVIVSAMALLYIIYTVLQQGAAGRDKQGG
jgi:hypothetical protein